MKTVFALFVVAVLGVGGWLFVRAKLAADPINNFRTASVKRGDVTSTISATGTVEAIDPRDVGAQVQGRILDFGIDPNDLKGRKIGDVPAAEKAKLRRVDFNTVVHKDTVLAYIDDAVYRAQWLQAQATLEHNVADLIRLKALREQMAAEWARAKRLRPDRAAVETDDPDMVDITDASATAETKAPAGATPGADKKAPAQKKAPTPKAIPSVDALAGATPDAKPPLLDYRAMSDSDYDLARANYRVAKANVLVGDKIINQSKAALDMAKTNLDYCTILSPVEGTIIARRVNIGQTVVAALSAPSLFLIAEDLTKMQVWASVNEADIDKIRSRKEMPVRFTVDACPGETFRGKVTQVRLNAQMTQNVVLYTVIVTFDNSDLRLIPYLTANVQFEVEERKDVLLVPNVALRWMPRKEQVAPDIRDSVTAVSQGKGGGKRGGKGAAGKAADKGATPGQESPPQTSSGTPPSPTTKAVASSDAGPTARGPAPSSETSAPSATGAVPGTKPGKTATDSKSPAADSSSEPASGPREQRERGRIWIKDDNYVRPIDVRIGLTDGNNTEIRGAKLEEGMEVVTGEARADDNADSTTNPFAPKLFRGGQQKKKSAE